MKTTYKAGDWNVICDVCGKKTKASKIKKRWDGFLVCPEDYEQRHPQDFLRVRVDKQTVPFSRPETTDTFTNIPYIDTGDSPYCTSATATGVADVCTANCARADIPAIGL